jgi:hypothetical protein
MKKWYPSVIGTMAFGFQVFILEPWHKQISNEIQELKESIKSSPVVSERIQ